MSKRLTYKDAGVDIDAADELVKRIRFIVRSTYTPRVYEPRFGGFAGMLTLDLPKGVLSRRYRNPLILLATDGVGTKLKIAFRTGIHSTVGIDLVAMCVNDILVYGAEPIAFLDYLACGRLDSRVIEEVITGIANGCRQAGSPLLGGETAELPGFYKKSEYDLAGFVVGAVEERRLIDGRYVEEGDIILGLLSSGLHSNGYSLVRKVFFEVAKWRLNRYIDEFGCTLAEELLRPTRIYVKPVLAVLNSYKQHAVRAMAHITGGGLIGNIPRVIPKGYKVLIRKNSWEVPPVFKLIQKIGSIDEKEMYRVFNMGIGFVMVIGERYRRRIRRILKRKNVETVIIGEVVRGDGGVELL